ncbi:DsbA family protein [Patescibacteria group bacterium]|nr:DsbA family protein [Patescibacteria group bacterium]MBU2036100.1 DsbA family protein [Patescibacteria group bacterium]
MSKKASISSIFEKALPVILVLIIALAFGVGFLWQKVANLEKTVSPKVADGQPAEAPTDPTGKLSKEDAKKVPGVKDSDHILGNKDADVAIIVYDDWECPYCKIFHETAKQAVEEYGGKVSLVYRQFPLDMLHQKARTEAEASECVAKLGGNDAFWKFIDLVLETTTSNDGLDLTLLPKFATQAGVNLTDYNACVKDGDTKEIVEKQIQEGQDAGVAGTPGSYAVNKKGEVWQIPGAVPLEMLKATIDEALK